MIFEIEMEKKTIGDESYIVEADLVWTGSQFERNVGVFVGKDGRIEKIGKRTGQETQCVVMAKGQALIPGFVNCHSHAFQRGLRGKGEEYPNPSEKMNSFWTWREEMYKLVENMTRDQFYDLCKQCYEEMLQSGITSVGEFHYFHNENFSYDRVILQAAQDAGIRIVLLNAFYQYGGFNKTPLNPSQKRFETLDLQQYWSNMDQLQKRLSSTQSLGVVAHSFRAVDMDTLVKLHQQSATRGMVFHIHLEEQPKEVEDCKTAYGRTGLSVLLEKLKIDSKCTAVHCTWSDPEELKQYVQLGGNVCICPLTEGNLGDGFPPLKSCGTNICLGTDCNARIDMIEEMRWLEYAHRLKQNQRGICSATTNTENISQLLFEFATVKGAQSLNLPVGELKAGNFADMALIDLSHPSLAGWTEKELMGSIIFGSSGSEIVTATCVDGKWKSHARTPPSISIESMTTLSSTPSEFDPAVNDVVELATLFINTQSLSGHEVPMADNLKAWLEYRGWNVHLQAVEPQQDVPDSTIRYNVFATRPGITNPRVLFNSHIDTVPPYFPARIDEKNLYGRGACDTKSLIAAQLLAAQELVDQHGITDIGLLYVVSEETDHSGMKEANELNLSPEAMIVAEPTDMKLMRLQKGILKLKLIRKGMAAHSGYPELGDSAIDPLLDVLHDLKKETWPSSPELGHTTLNIGMIEGGQAANAIPEDASAFLMFRVTHDPDALYKRVMEIVNGRVQVNMFSKNFPVHLGQIEGMVSDVASFNTDIPYFTSSKETIAYLIGPGNITDAHCSREFIPLQQLRDSIQTYRDMAIRLLQRSS